jgi:hypothetical protein
MRLRVLTRLNRLVLLLVVTVHTVGAEAAPVKGWDRVLGIPKTQKVKIHLQDGTTLKGRIEEVGPEGLTLVQGRSLTQVKAAEIVDITRTSRLKGALWGGIAGTAVSAPILAASAGYLMDKNNPTVTDRLGMALAGSIIFGGIGAGAGAAIGTADTIYRAPKSANPVRKTGSP